MSIDAMKQALEALEYIENNYMSLPKAGNDAITALRLAIEQAERQEPVSCQYAVDVAMPEYRCVGKCQYTTPPQQPMVVSKECAERGCMAHDDRVDGPGVVIERPWVGLTDAEIKEIVGPYGDTPVTGYTRKLFDQIEAKLKEKNT
jgi:hypothetical protein